MMRSFHDIFDIAAEHHGGVDALETKLGERPYGPPLSADPSSLPDDRWLAAFTRFIFCSGFSWKVIDQKWPGFEDAFWAFNVNRCAMMSDDDLTDLTSDTRIVRNGQKIVSVRDNAIFLKSLADSHGTAATHLALWPKDDFIGLIRLLRTSGSRLGGTTAQYALRHIGVDGYILTEDVSRALIREGVVEKMPTGKAAQDKAQAAFNAWRAESGRSLTEISRTLALSVG
ncbi:MAG: DNA-3-methyladenine glycosylase I [Pseudomonadota bacterium]